MQKSYRHRLTICGPKEKINECINLLSGGNNNLFDLTKIITFSNRADRIKKISYSWGKHYKKDAFFVTFTTTALTSPEPLDKLILKFPELNIKLSVRVR